MLHTLGWVIRTWLKITVGLAVVVGLVWLFTDHPGYVVAAVICAGLADLWVIRALCQEWVFEARVFCWWWPKR
jgi:hypothetical protein